LSKILITGYSSNLGSELISNLELQGHEIICLGRTKPVGKFKWFPWTLGQNPPKEAFEKVNILLHLAWPTVSRSDKTSHLAIGGSERLIKTAELYGVRIVFISTMSVYAINSVYGAAKKEVESMIGANNMIVRLGYVVTPRSLLSKLEKIFCKANIAIVPNQDKILRITSVEDS
jgi:nucleoside-diphosphate-sugar epimerase